MTSLKSSPISATIQAGSEIMLRPRRRIVSLGLTAVTIVAVIALRSTAIGAGRRPMVLPAVFNWNDCVKAVSNLGALGLFAPPSVGTNDDPGSLSIKLLLVG